LSISKPDTTLFPGAPAGESDEIFFRRVNPSVLYSPSPKMGEGRDGGSALTDIPFEEHFTFRKQSVKRTLRNPYEGAKDIKVRLFIYFLLIN
jgi:hypothetical protein